MASRVPKFGDLQNGGSDVGHTGYFPTARRGNSITNPNEPQMNREMGPSRQSKAPPPKAKEGIKANEPRPKTHGVTFAGGESSVNKDQGAPGRPQQRSPASSRGANNPGRGGSVPVFGDWNNNPAQAGGYTVVFDKLHEDKKKGNIPSADSPSTSNRNTPSRPIKPHKKSGCFPRLFR